MRARQQRGQSRGGWAAAVTSWICILLVAESCAAQNSPAPGAVHGTVADASGSMVEAAIVRLQAPGSTAPRTTLTDQTGSFHFSAVEPGAYTLTITAGGFTDAKTDISVVSGENPPLPPVVLQIASAVSKVDVTLPPHELATQQVHAEEKQRLLGIIPNFYVTYDPNAAPLTAGQKFHLGLRTLIDPETILGNAASAGIEQWRNATDRQFGQGMAGYGKRFGVDYAASVTHVLIGHTLTQSVFHQDPRYFYKGTGSLRSRFLYAVGTAFVAKGDNGHWQPDYSDIIGGLATREILSPLHSYTSRPGLRAFHGFLLGFSGRASDHLIQEFVYRWLTTHVPKTAARRHAVLREGTPIELLSVEDLRSATGTARPVTFVLSKDVEAGGVVAAKAGTKVMGQVTSTAAPSASGAVASMHLSVEKVQLQIGETDVPLRSTPQKAGTGAVEYHWLEDTGRVSLVLYIARDVTLAPAR